MAPQARSATPEPTPSALLGVPIDHTAGCGPECVYYRPRACGCGEGEACHECAGPRMVPVKLAVGDVGPETVGWVSAADLADDPPRAISEVLHRLGDAAEETVVNGGTGALIDDLLGGGDGG